MAKRKAKTQAEIEYNKQLRRIKQFVRRAEKRGYTFDDGYIPDKPQKITQSSVNRLRKLTPDKLYSRASYVDSTGVIRKGRQKKTVETSKVKLKKSDEYIRHPKGSKDETAPKQNRKPTSDKGETKKKSKYKGEYTTQDLIKDVEERREKERTTAEERLKKDVPWERESYLKYLVEIFGIDSKEVQEYLKEHPEQQGYYNVLNDDLMHKGRLEYESDYRQQFTQGNLVYERMISTINDWRNTGNFDFACDFVEQRINDAIESVGKDIAMKNLAQYNDTEAKQDIDMAILYFGQENGSDKLQKIVNIIMQRPLTAEESIHFSSLIEDRMTDNAEYYKYTGEEFDF